MEAEMLITELKNRAEKLRLYIADCERFLKRAPEGKLRSITIDKQPRYYVRYSNKDTNGKYLSSKTDIKHIKLLARKHYCEKVLKEARIELKKIEDLLAYEQTQPIPMQYLELKQAEKALIEPFEEPMEDRIKRWQSAMPDVVPPKEGSYVIPTKRGEYVRSKAEYNIANALYANKIPYKYEPSYMSKDGTYSRPDFQVMNPSTGEILYWEHFGMLDKAYYVKDMINKLNGFEESELYPGKGLIVTFDDGTHPLTQDHILQIINDLLR